MEPIGSPATNAPGAKSRAFKTHRVPALDGVRGIAILLVLLNHFATGVEPHMRGFSDRWTGHGGGLLGVQLFFVLSGFLITSLLMSEFEQSARISVRDFYLRRVRRLMPALIVVCAAYGLFALIAERDQLPEAGGSILRALTYTGNIPFPFPKNTALVHTWSLAVEEQFYLVWPVLTLLLLRRSRKLAVWTAMAGIALTIVARELVPYVVHGDRAYWVQYNGFRWDALMIGALLALRPIAVSRWIGWVGLVTGAMIVIFTPDGTIPGWLFTLSTFASAAIVATAVQMGWISNRVLVYIGTISYSLYLWHVLVLRLDIPWLVSLVITFVVSALSYRFIELQASKRLFQRANREHGEVAVPGR